MSKSSKPKDINKMSFQDLLYMSKDSVISLAIESWKFSRTFKSLLQNINVIEQKKYLGKLSWYEKKIEDYLTTMQINLVNLEGEKYDIGIAATAINLGEFKNDDELFVDKMIEPVVMVNNELHKAGTLLVKRAQK